MFRLINAEVKSLTPELAQQFRDLEASPTERELNPGRVRHLREKAEAGHLITFHWATAKLGKKVMRMNGQHSSTMLCELNGHFPTGMRAHIDEYEADEPKDLAELFRQFDDRKSGRSTGDVAGAYQGLVDALSDVPKESAKLAADGVAWWRRHIEGIAVAPGDGVYDIFNERATHSFIIWIGELFGIKTPELKRVQIVAAMYATFIANENSSKTFWMQVARGGVEYEDNAPATVLDTWLKEAKETRDARTQLKPGNYYQGCIYAWNAYRDEKSLKDIKFDSKKGFHRVSE